MLSLIGIGRQRKSGKSGASGRLRPSVLLRRRRQFLLVVVAFGFAAGLGSGTFWLRTAGVVGLLANQIELWQRQAVRAVGLTVREVYVVGRSQAGRGEILRALGIRRGDEILRFDPGLARERLVARGWIQDAKVFRRLPDVVEVHLHERDPLVLWQQKNRLLLIDRGGVVITRDGIERFRDLPIVLGSGARKHAADLVDMLRLQPELFAQVDAAVRIGDRRWNLKLKNGIEVNLPELDTAASWMQLAQMVAEHGLFKRDIKVIDMRLPDRLVVRMMPAAAAKQREPGKDT